ncbi:MAG: nicotinate phosphoribosyltransferase [Thermodesulfobacteriota bacterium]
MVSDALGSGLFTDLYELTMAQAYYRRSMHGRATFSLFIRKYPPNRAYFVNAGLENVLTHLEAFRFSEQERAYLQSTGLFSREFLDYLGTLRFRGDVHALPEGRIFFADEPVLEVTAPIIEAQMVESAVINRVNLQVMIATKASRCVYAARGRGLVDFSLRRTQGSDAALSVARASYIAGFAGTSNVLAGRLYGIPINGTMAHSYVTSFEREEDAFRVFAETFPDHTVLLLDTYDTLSGARKAVQVGKEMLRQGRSLRGVRLDSGDMAGLSRRVREILREEGLTDTRIFASGGFDEYEIARALERGAEIDAFGVGTNMGVSADAPYTDMAYKLVQYDGRPILKLSEGKESLVGKKQVFRTWKDGRMIRDTIALRHEKREGEPLLIPVMKAGRRLGPGEPLTTLRERFRQEFAGLDERSKALEKPEGLPVELSDELSRLQTQTAREVRQRELGVCL